MLATTHSDFFEAVQNITIVRPYIKVTRPTVQTDQEALQAILSTGEASSKLARWRLRLSQLAVYNFHHSDIKTRIADGLLRLRTKDEDRNLLDVELSVLTILRNIFHM